MSPASFFRALLVVVLVGLFWSHSPAPAQKDICPKRTVITHSTCLKAGCGQCRQLAWGADNQGSCYAYECTDGGEITTCKYNFQEVGCTALGAPVLQGKITCTGCTYWKRNPIKDKACEGANCGGKGGTFQKEWSMWNICG